MPGYAAILLGVIAIALSACAGGPAGHSAGDDLGVMWVKHAAEYRAISHQVYNEALEDLPRYLEDRTFSAVPGQRDAGGLPPAVILDIDETVVSNVDFQLVLVPPFSDEQFDAWQATTIAAPMPGMREFVDTARRMGVEIWFVTNRACEARPGIADPCPQEATTLGDLAQAGISASDERVLLANERPEWTREKLVRREHIAESYRVLMLIGDDLADFLPCVRAGVVPPCTKAADAGDRREAVVENVDRWGNGWYVLPNPMHGSWTQVR